MAFSEEENSKALAACNDYGREVLGMANPEGHMLEILEHMSFRAERGTLTEPQRQAYNVAMAGFRRLFFGDAQGAGNE